MFNFEKLEVWQKAINGVGSFGGLAAAKALRKASTRNI
jgi:hypothetical protein